MMYQVMFDGFAVFDDLITHTTRWPECRTDGNGRSNRGNLFNFRVMMALVMVPFLNPRVTHAVMMMPRSQGFRYNAHEH